MTKRNASNMILSHRRCYGCGREEKNVCCSICPDCGHFMHPIGYVYVPAINNGDRQTVEKSDSIAALRVIGMMEKLEIKSSFAMNSKFM